MSPRLRTLLMTSTALLALGAMPVAAQPTGGNVVGGSATISGAGTNSVIVNQSSDRAIINWNTFNIGTGGSATFNQPGSSSITLNRVTGGLGPSTIDGTISANGRVFIINRDGMLFGRNAVINTAGFLATTSDIRNADFMAGRMNFNIPGRPDASIVNLGNITASSGGFAALVAPGVRNSGTISANLGTVALASGNSFTLDMYGDKLIQVAVGDEIAGKVIDVATGKPLSSLVSNEGTLRANGGRVEISAAAARHVVDSVINNRGVIEANSVGTRNGKIVLGGATAKAGLPKQTVKIAGKISATGKDKGAKGGTIEITGEDIRFAAAMLDVSGHSGGGKILVGGDYGGGRPIPGIVNNQSAVLEDHAIATASTVTVDAASTFNASATANGNGGKVILWSDGLTTFAGTIFARGGEQGGNGGFVEVSGQQQLAFSGQVSTRAPHGATGTLLLDPFDMMVSTAPDSINNVNATTLSNQLQDNDVVISTSGAGPSPGDITVSAGVTWSAATTLTLHADRNVVINAPISAVNGGLTIDAGNQISATAAVNVGTFTLTNGAWVQNTAALPAFHAKDFRIVNGSFLRVTGGDGDNTAYQIADIYGLQGVGSSESLLNSRYRLANNIDASVTATWNNGAGFVPIGNISASFGGSLNGQNFTINGLTIRATPSTQHVGLFGVVDDAFINNLKLTNINIAAGADGQVLGGLVGTVDGGATFIENVSVSGTIDAAAHTSITAGGLVGLNRGSILDSSAAVNVSIGNGSGGEFNHYRDAHAGGLVGHNFGVIADSSASGNVMGGGNALIGGLVGSNGDISNGFYDLGSESSGPMIIGSFATGTVNIVNNGGVLQMAAAGGLVGDNWGLVESSYATGNVGVTGNVRIVLAGGLVGQLMAPGDSAMSTIRTSYASGNVSLVNTYAGNDDGSSVGGLVGATQAGDTTISNSYALGNVSVTSSASAAGLFAGGLIGSHSSSVENSYSTGAVTVGPDNVAAAAIGGFIGNREFYSIVTAGYWDKTSSGLTAAIGVGSADGTTGLKAGEAFTQSKYAGFDFGVEGHWFMLDGQTRPFLRMEWSETIRNTHQLQLIAMRPGETYQYQLANNIDFAGAFSASGMWGTTGFAPIGTLYGSLNGSLNGNNFTINALKIAPNDTSTRSIGLFGAIAGSASVTNLNITNAVVTANTGFEQPEGGPLAQWIGILAGQSAGTISNVTATGTVDGLSVAGVIAGGLVGQHGILGYEGHTAGTITNSHANVNVTVGNGDTCPGSCMFNAAGGLVGANVGGSSITNSYAEGAIVGGARTFAGGLVGQNGFFVPTDAQGSITNSYATGHVTVTGANSAAGGLVGSNTPGSTITNAQAFGNVTSSHNATSDEQTSSAGGLVGENWGIITSSVAPLLTTSNCTAGSTVSCASGHVAVGAGGIGGGLAGSNHGEIANSFATGNVSGATGLDESGVTILGGLAGLNAGDISHSFARTGTIGSADGGFTIAGGFVGENIGTIAHASASGHVQVGDGSVAGGFVGANIGQIQLSFAKGNVSAGDNSVVGGFTGFNFGEINQAYAIGTVQGGANSLVGGFVGINLGLDTRSLPSFSEVSTETHNFGSITQSYALGATTGGNQAVVAAFAALNLGSLDQVYGVGHVQGGTNSTLRGLVGLNNLTGGLPELGIGVPEGVLPTGTATNSYWDMQTTAATTSAGGTGMNTSVLAGGLPPGFDPGVWDSHSYPFLVNLQVPPQNTTPLPPIIPPVNVDDPFLQPPIQQISPPAITVSTTTNDPVPNTTQFLQQQQAQQQQQQQQQQQGQGGNPPPAPQPIRLDVGDENRYFYLPPPGETRLVVNEVVLQMPCNVPQTTLDGILKQHNLSVVASQCLQEGGGNAAFRMRHASDQAIAAVIRALAAHQIIAAAQANYLYTLAETKVQSATSQQGDPGQYVPEKLRLYDAHRLVRGANVPIAVIDSEIDGAHPDLSGTIANRYDATGVDDTPHAHGTGMAGAIVSHQKLLGVAPDARILAIRAFSTRATNAESTTYHILRGIDYAVANNVRIINMSFAGPRDPSLERAIKAAYDKGIVMIAAAGNAGPRSPALYPAADPNVIAVTAIDADDRLFDGANRGTHVAIAAPGVDVLVPAPAGEYQVTTGTSVATAHVSGVVALMLERNPKLSPTDVRKILAASARRLGPANQFGAGLIDPVRAIEMAIPRGAAAPQPASRTTVAVRP